MRVIRRRKIKRKKLTAAQLAHRKRQAVKKRKRTKRERELATRIKALPDKKFGVILADPPWRFDVYSRDTGLDRAADNHYPTQTLEEIMALPVRNIAAPDCVLYLWATVPMLPQALAVMDAWGFYYRSSCVWVKDKIGTGYWNRNAHEYLLIGARGRIVAPFPGDLESSVFNSPRFAHSSKPWIAQHMIEAHWPNVPKIELYARGPRREGWDEPWGAEADCCQDQAPPCGGGHLPMLLSSDGESMTSPAITGA